MRTNPEPDDQIVGENPNSATIASDPRGVDGERCVNLFEAKTWVAVVSFEEGVGFVRPVLHFFWEFRQHITELASCRGIHSVTCLPNLAFRPGRVQPRFVCPRGQFALRVFEEGCPFRIRFQFG